MRSHAAWFPVYLCIAILCLGAPFLLSHYMGPAQDAVLPSSGSSTRPSPSPSPSAERPTNKTSPPVAAEDSRPLPPTREATRDVVLSGLTPAPKRTGPLIRVKGSLRAKPDHETEQPEPLSQFNRIIVLDAGSLQAQNLLIRLSGINPLAADDHCTLPDGQDWPCGRVARTALRGFIRSRRVACAVQAGGEEDDDTVLARCSVGPTDIGLWLIAQGWARPTADGDEDAEKALADARSDKRGQWRLIWP